VLWRSPEYNISLILTLPKAKHSKRTNKIHWITIVSIRNLTLAEGPKFFRFFDFLTGGRQKIEKINIDTKMTIFSRRIFFEKFFRKKFWTFCECQYYTNIVHRWPSENSQVTILDKYCTLTCHNKLLFFLEKKIWKKKNLKKCNRFFSKIFFFKFFFSKKKVICCDKWVYNICLILSP
jgi:hypothetical protein